jgi:hypothetical protein
VITDQCNTKLHIVVILHFLEWGEHNFSGATCDKMAGGTKEAKDWESLLGYQFQIQYLGQSLSPTFPDDVYLHTDGTANSSIVKNLWDSTKLCTNKNLHTSYSFICCLFNDALNVADYTPSNDRMSIEQWVGKDVEGSGRDLIWGVIPKLACSADLDWIGTLLVDMRTRNTPKYVTGPPVPSRSSSFICYYIVICSRVVTYKS